MPQSPFANAAAFFQQRLPGLFGGKLTDNFSGNYRPDSTVNLIKGHPGKPNMNSLRVDGVGIVLFQAGRKIQYLRRRAGQQLSSLSAITISKES